MTSSQADERTRLLPPDHASSALVSADRGHAAAASGQTEKQQQLSFASFKFWLLVLSYSSLLFLFSSNATMITTMLFAIAEELEAYQNAATWMTASYMVRQRHIPRFLKSST